MWRDLRGARAIGRAAWELLRLELKLMTGGRLTLLLVIQAAWVGFMFLVQRLREEPLEPHAFYGWSILLPAMLPAISLGMSCILWERDVKHLEMSFASPGGRYLLWSFRLASLAAVAAASCVTLSVVTWLILARDLSPLWSAPHAFVPVVLAGVLAAFLSVLFNNGSVAALLTVVLLIVGSMLPDSVSPWTNPFSPPPGLIDPNAWTRTVADNRLFLLAVIAACVAMTLGLLQRRERLL